MTPSSITLGGRGGRLSHAASVKSGAVGGRVALPPTRNERKFISYLTCGADRREEQSLSRPLPFFTRFAAQRESFHFSLHLRRRSGRQTQT